MNRRLDDRTLERLNALAVSRDPGARNALSTELLQLIREQVRQRTSRLKVALLVTEPALVDLPPAELEAVAAQGSIVERACALTRLLGKQVPSDSSWLPRRANWQRELSKLLVRYPVLMDHRLAFPGYAQCAAQSPQIEQAPLPHLLAYAPSARLPALGDGIEEAALRRFASCASVKAGLTRACFDSPLGESRLAARTVLEVLTSATVPLRARFLASLLDLSDLARQETGSGILLATPASHRESELLYAHLAAIFWDVAADGARSELSRAEFVHALTLPADSSCRVGCEELLPYYLALQLSTGLGVGEPGSAAAVGHKSKGVANAIGMLTEIGCHPDVGAAAQWIAGQLVGQARIADGACEEWQPNEILAVLDQLEIYGARAKMPAPNQVLPAATWREQESLDRWAHAIEMHARRADMQATIAARSAADTAAAASSMEPRRRLRTV